MTLLFIFVRMLDSFVDTLKPTLVPVNSGDFQNGRSRPFVFYHQGLKLHPLEHWSFIIHINHLHRQNLGGGQLRNPMILCHDGQVVDFLLLPV